MEKSQIAREILYRSRRARVDCGRRARGIDGEPEGKGRRQDKRRPAGERAALETRSESRTVPLASQASDRSGATLRGRLLVRSRSEGRAALLSTPGSRWPPLDPADPQLPPPRREQPSSRSASPSPAPAGDASRPRFVFARPAGRDGVRLVRAPATGGRSEPHRVRDRPSGSPGLPRTSRRKPLMRRPERRDRRRDPRRGERSGGRQGRFGVRRRPRPGARMTGRRSSRPLRRKRSDARVARSARAATALSSVSGGRPSRSSSSARPPAPKRTGRGSPSSDAPESC